MAIRNATLFKLLTDGIVGGHIVKEALETALEKHRYQPPSASDYASSGWVEPAINSASLVLTLSPGIYAMRRLTTSKILPAATINKAVNEKVSALETAENRKVGRKEKLPIKETIISELLTRTVCKDDVGHIIINTHARLIITDQSSRENAETLVKALHKSCPDIHGLRINTRNSTAQQLTRWAIGDDTPDNLYTGTAITLQGESSEDPKVTISNHHLGNEEVQQHLRLGLITHQLAMWWRDRTQFKVNSKLQLKSIRTDIPIEEASNPEDHHARLLLDCIEISDIALTLIASMDGWTLNSSDDQPLTDAVQSWLDDPKNHFTSVRTSQLQRTFAIPATRAEQVLYELEKRGFLTEKNAIGTRDLTCTTF